MTTTNKALTQPAYNSTSWDVPLNSNFGILDTSLGSTATVSNTTAYTLVAAEYQCMRLLFNGSLASDLTITIPSGVGGSWVITNSTTDVSAAVPCYLTIKTTAGGSTGINPPRGSTVTIYSDGTNVGFADPNYSPPGSLLQFAGSTAPTGYLTCDGTAISRSTYSALFAAIGTTWGSGNGTTTFNIPDLRGSFLRGSGTSSLDPSSPRAVGTFQAEAYLNHTHALTDPGHFHTAGTIISGAQGTGSTGNVAGVSATTTNTTGITISASTTGGTETRPDNYAVLMCIKT